MNILLHMDGIRFRNKYLEFLNPNPDKLECSTLLKRARQITYIWCDHVNQMRFATKQKIHLK